MSWFYRRCIRPVLFEQDSEIIHERTLNTLAWVSTNETLSDMLTSLFESPGLPVQLFGLSFPNPVGLAAGMDKFAAAVPAWAALGFGFCELGGVTWHPQPGNPKPRIFRAVTDEALINRMGFNNPGAEALSVKLAECRARGRWPRHPVGINLGKSKITPLEDAAGDYKNSFEVLWPHADFFVVNVSSPNTPNLRQLQDKASLDEILAALQEANRAHARSSIAEPNLKEGAEVQGPRSKVQSPRSKVQSPRSGVQGPRSSSLKPILVKIAPDLSFEALDDILEVAETRHVAGIVATNTTVTRPVVADHELQRIYSEAGGLSGRPLRFRSTEIIRHLYRQTRGQMPIIGVGGIFDSADAWEKITAGASLIQLYTGLIYEGPGVVKKIVTGLRERLTQAGCKNLKEAVGSQFPVNTLD